MKKYAIYLPQFHEIEENNKWWGKGYTEWTCVKAAKPLFKGHIQPKLPANDNYYNLLKPDTLEWQAELAKNSGVDGFIFYHYWFEGKLIMEKPIEILYEHKEIDIEYYFCWANHTWYKGTGKDRKILLDQTYGNKETWKKHYNYFSKFFKDARYKKEENCPILMIYNPYFDEKNEMMDYFDKLAKEDGFNGIHIVEVYKENLSKKRTSRFMRGISPKTTAVLLREPSVSLAEYYRFHPFLRIWIRLIRPELEKRGIQLKYVHRLDGNRLYSRIIRYNTSDFGSVDIINGAFFEWDNTPRHNYRGYIISPPSKNIFKEYMESIKDNKELVINAWNEWAEGMMLEPTQVNGDEYLHWLREWKDK